MRILVICILTMLACAPNTSHISQPSANHFTINPFLKIIEKNDSFKIHFSPTDYFNYCLSNDKNRIDSTIYLEDNIGYITLGKYSLISKKTSIYIDNNYITDFNKNCIYKISFYSHLNSFPNDGIQMSENYSLFTIYNTTDTIHVLPNYILNSRYEKSKADTIYVRKKITASIKSAKLHGGNFNYVKILNISDYPILNNMSILGELNKSKSYYDLLYIKTKKYHGYYIK